MEKVKTFEIKIYVGLREQYNDFIHSIDAVRNICDNYVNIQKDCVTITPTEFRYVNGWEPGVIIGLINYPRFLRSEMEIIVNAHILAKQLMEGLCQFRVSIVHPRTTWLLENDKLIN